MERVPALALIFALSLGLVSLALLARLPKNGASRGVRRLPITLLLYNLWVAGFLAANYVSDRWVAQETSRALPPHGDAWAVALLALALAWLCAHVLQLQAFLGSEPGDRARRATKYIFAAVAIVVMAAWLISSVSGRPSIFRIVVSLGSGLVLPVALGASMVFYVRSRRLDDIAWRARLSALGVAYIGLFACLLALSISWSRLASGSRLVPIAVDAILELIYNAVAIVWVTRLSTWLEGETPHAAAPPLDRARLLMERGITRREAEIIELICLGKTNQEIADQLFISLATVKDHNYIAFQKLGVRNRTELTRLVLGSARALPK